VVALKHLEMFLLETWLQLLDGLMEKLLIVQLCLTTGFNFISTDECIVYILIKLSRVTK
jgi:hypothetical protein